MEKMSFDEQKQVDIYNPDFDVMRNELNIGVKQTLAEMIEKDMNAGSIALRIDISTAKLHVPDKNAPMGNRPAVRIEMGYKVGYTVQSKGETKGDIVSIKNPKELVVDDMGRFFMVSEEEASGQLSMFNSWDEYREAVTQ